ITEQEEDLLITIADTGAGVPNQTGDKLFEQFYQAERITTGSKAGFGIGLFLVKHFTGQHKGRISYTSEEGKGATFFLSLLKGAEHFAGIPIVETDASGPVFLQALKEEPVVEEEKGEGNNLPLTDVVTDKQTILIIDDDEQIRNYLAQLFKDTYIIQQAASGAEGLKAAQTWLPDLIISDVHMQEMNGIELCKQVKENETLNHIPVILLTASTSDDIRLKGVEGGADDYITKPFDNKLLQARVTSLLKSRNTLQRYFYNEITLNKNNQRISQEYKEFLEKCIAIVENHLDDDSFTVKTLMAEMGMSHSNLFRKVKSVSGQSVNIFIRFIRLRKAAEMFINTNYNVNETAVMVGINDIKYFREQFNKLFGMNPSEYIRRYRKVHGKQYTVDKERINPGDRQL
ncbi:MAG TPA: response regulator, partial [Niastella sp.]|nr:response regulator [Niastella sp.]